ncbi:MAG: DUF4831 family protein, partial [Prevotella sp.]|nr:DUF4831 family protein [Prevotella sp.]
TAILLKATFLKKTRKAGEFYRYADRYLNIPNPITADEVLYSLEKVEVATIGIPDKNNSYLVEFKTNSLAPFVTLTKDGLICAINEEVGFTVEDSFPLTAQPENPPVAALNPKTYFSEEILRAGSTAKQAELIAKQIYHLRESKTNILTGEADNMPPDGNAYKLAISQIDEQEKALTSIFAGTETHELQTRTFTLIPDEMNIDKRTVFRFSKKLGVVEANNLAGAPVTLTLTSNEPREEIVLTEKEQKAQDKKFSSGIIYNIPAKASLKIEYNNRILLQKECDVVQYGIQDVLTPKMLDIGKNPVKVIFYPELGAIKQIVQ